MKMVIKIVCALASVCFTATVWAKSIAVEVDRYLPDSRGSAPVTFGVPFPDGELPVSELGSVRVVDDRGQVVMHQQNALAGWETVGKKGVRWLLIDMLVDPERKYHIEYGKGAPAERVTVKDIARVEGDKIVIDAGVVRGAVNTKGGFEPFTTLTSFGAPVAVAADEPAAVMAEVIGGTAKRDPIDVERARRARPPARFNGFYVEHENKGVFRSDLDKAAKVVLEENGPIRATLKADGWYTNAAGERFCRYSVRMSIYRDRPDIKFEHTFIYTGMSKDDRITNIGARVNRADVEEGKKARVYFGGDDLAAGTVVADAGPRNYIVQGSSERGRMDFYSLSETGNVAKWADRGGGWLYAIGNQGYCVAIRDAWQQLPWGIRVFDGLIDVELWPQAAGPLDTTWDGYWSSLTERQKRTLAGEMDRKERDLDKWMDRLRLATNATGAAKTHEVWMSFIGPEYKRVPWGAQVTSSQMAREVAYPVLAWADPAWMCASQALDWQPHMVMDKEHYPSEEATFRGILQLMFDAVASNQWYGWWDWGGYHQHPTIGEPLPSTGLWSDDAGPSRGHRARPKSHYQWGRFPWVEFMRGGGRTWLRYAQTYTLYSADRAHAHHTGNGRENGGEYHYDNSVVPWMGGFRFSPGGDQLTSNLQAKDDYLYMYWLTGERRPVDVLKANGELILTKTAAGDKSFTWKPGFTRGNDIRNAGMQLDRLIALYQATANPAYLKLAKSVAAAFYPLDTTEKVAHAELNPPEGDFHQALSWAYQGMWFYWSVTHDASFKPALMAFINRARDYNGAMPGNGAARALGYGYLLTGDLFYLDMARAGFDHFASRGVTTESFYPEAKQELSPMPGLLGIMAGAPEAWRKANLPMGDRGRTVTYRYYNGRGAESTRASKAYFRKPEGKAMSFTVVTNAGGTFRLTGPAGVTVAQKKLDETVCVWARFEVPSEGPGGDYTLECVEPSERIKKNPKADQPPMARVIGSTVPVTIEMGGRGQMLPAMARVYYMRVPEDSKGAGIYLGELDAKREARVFEVGGGWSQSTLGMAPRMGGGYRLAVPEAMRGKMIGLTFVQDPEGVYDVKGVTPAYVMFEGLPVVVAASPEDYFVPKAMVKDGGDK